MNDSPAPLKSMEMFAIDNAGSWGKGAVLLGDLVVWPDKGMYPGYAPVGFLTHPNFDGTVVVQAGNRGIVITFIPGIPSSNQKGLREAMSDKVKRPEQYRIGIEALLQRLLLAGAGTGEDLRLGAAAHGHDAGVDPMAMVAWLSRHYPKEAAVMEDALKRVAKAPEPITYTDIAGQPRAMMKEDTYQAADDMLVAIGEARRRA